jgi:transmembrane sensor
MTLGRACLPERPLVRSPQSAVAKGIRPSACLTRCMTDRPPDSGSPTEHVDWDALARYLAGESTAEEADAMGRWLAERPDRAELVAALDRSFGRLAYRAPEDLDVEAALRGVRARRDRPDVRPSRDPARPSPSVRRHPFAPRPARWTTYRLRAAAAVAAIAAGSTLFWWSRGEDARRDAPALAQTYTTAVGQRDSLRLPDGTRVLLGPGSRLAVDQGYGTRHREVGLHGEAYFVAQHGGPHPFTVRAGNGTVRDIGTEFAVHSDPGDGVRVVVTSGAVVLHAGSVPADSGVTLRHGDRGVLQPGGRIVAERGVATEEDLAWTRGRLVFREAPLTQVRADLRRWYGIELQVTDRSIADKHVTAAFDGEPAQRVLEVLALILGADVERRGDTAVLRARTTGAPRR